QQVKRRRHAVGETARVDLLGREVQERGLEPEAARVLAAPAGVGVNLVLFREPVCAEGFHCWPRPWSVRGPIPLLDESSLRVRSARHYWQNSQNECGEGRKVGVAIWPWACRTIPSYRSNRFAREAIYAGARVGLRVRWRHPAAVPAGARRRPHHPFREEN